MIGALTNHLWQSTVFAAAAALLALGLGRNPAHVRYWVWLSASAKFLVPFSLFVSLGGWAWEAALPGHRVTPVVSTNVAAKIAGIAQPFPTASFLAPAVRSTTDWIPIAALFAWACGFLAIAVLRLRDWMRIRAAVRASKPLELAANVAVRSAPGLLEPGMVGFLRPVLLVPEGIAGTLTQEQFEAVLAHEQCHARRRDNLTAIVQMVVEAMFWFYPLVWWIGAKLVEERERACDEEVLNLGNKPGIYAEGILKICAHYLESPLRCAPGVTGSDLKKRIRAILSRRASVELNFARRALIGFAVVAAFGIPIFAGALGVSAIRGQSDFRQFQFEVASIKPSDPSSKGGFIDAPGPGPVQATFIAKNFPMMGIVRMAYGMPFGANDGRLIGAPSWLESARYDIEAKMDDATLEAMNKLAPAEQQEAMKSMIQALLAERCQLKAHSETREMTVYYLVVAKGGPKLQEANEKDYTSGVSASGRRQGLGMRGRGGPLEGGDTPIVALASVLSTLLSRQVIDKTGLTGKYDFTLQWTPDEGQGGFFKDGGAPGPGQPAPAEVDSNFPSLFGAIQQQLGLKLEAGKGPVEVIVIDHMEKPSAN